MDGDRGLTELLLYVIPDLEYYNLVGGIGTVEQYELAWSQAGYYLESLIDNKGNLGLLVDFLKAEFHAKHDIDPQIQKLRELLGSALKVADKVRLDGSLSADLRLNFINLGNKCGDWIGWIDRYFPPEQSKQEQDNEEPIKQGNKPKRISAVAKKLATPELQAVKQKLVDAELINDGGWAGSPAEFGCLVQELLEQYKVANNGGMAWTACAEWAGYTGSINAARNAIDANPNTRGDNAETIRRICKKK